jgi:hypothetical protein
MIELQEQDGGSIDREDKAGAQHVPERWQTTSSPPATHCHWCPPGRPQRRQTESPAATHPRAPDDPWQRQATAYGQESGAWRNEDGRCRLGQLVLQAISSNWL